MPARPKILFLIAEDWYFLSHRLSLARACRDRGWDVYVATRLSAASGHGASIEAEGINVISIKMRRDIPGLVHEISSILDLVKIIRRIRPDILHQVGLKPIVYGSLAARFAAVGAVINALAGKGYVFISGEFLPRVMRTLLRMALAIAINKKKSWMIVQNVDDENIVKRWGLVDSEKVMLIRGAGVDLNVFTPAPEPDGPVAVIVVSRMLEIKGIREMVLASRVLEDAGVPVRVQLVGPVDPYSLSSLRIGELESWRNEACVEWLGEIKDVSGVLAQAHIAVLPSHGGEGIPKSLLEAAAAGLPIITTDVPGCREVVEDGVNGYLVPRNDWIALADAIRTLVASSELRKRFGAASRAKAEKEFGINQVVEDTLALYVRAARMEPEDRPPA